MKGIWTTVFVVVGFAASGGCQQATTDEPPSGNGEDADVVGNQDQERLQSLLRDAPLTHTPALAAVTREPPPSSVVLPGTEPAGVWLFNDCNLDRTLLVDSGGPNHAFRSVGAACATGMDQLSGVLIANPEDIVYVPDQPDFGLQNGVTVAGWFKPSVVSGVNTLFRKRDNGTSSFALLLNSGRFEFVVNLRNAAFSVASPQRARPGVFHHVAATYDGLTARLYVGGVEVASRVTRGSIAPGPGPLLLGNDGSERRFDGVVDDSLFATHAITAEQVRALLCLQPDEPPSFSVTPQEIPTLPAGTTLRYDFAFTNNNAPGCPAITANIEIRQETPGITFDRLMTIRHHTQPIAPGATGHLVLAATLNDDLPPGFLASFSTHVRIPASDSLFELSHAILVAEPDREPGACGVVTAHELMITNLFVVDDPVRTVFTPGSTDPRNGVWSFKHLMEGLAATPADAPAMVEAMLNSMNDRQRINGFDIDGRPGVEEFVLAHWPRTSDRKLDLARAPLRLQAIVNRFDLRNLDNGDAGEGRFVFAFEHLGLPLEATMIFEYKLPAASERDVLDWAHAFHDLGALPFGERYNAALQAITQRFVARGVRPGHPNGSAINAVRTNEISFGANQIWELREFRLSPSTGRLEPRPLELTPSNLLDGTSTLSAFINVNHSAIIAEQHTVPAVFAGHAFQGGAVFNGGNSWTAFGTDGLARHRFAMNTCNGCHSPETGVFFLQIIPRFGASEATLSSFLTGTVVSDPQTGEPRSFDDLRRRRLDLESIVCSDPAALTGASLRRGISRVH